MGSGWSTKTYHSGDMLLFMSTLEPRLVGHLAAMLSSHKVFHALASKRDGLELGQLVEQTSSVCVVGFVRCGHT